MTRDQLIFVPAPIYRLIPFYNGDKSKLNFFLRKCEYVIDMFKGNEAQNVYLFHTVTSRLVDKAAALISAREDIKTWSQLKDLLIQNYGDPRSEESIAVVFESLKKKPHESLLNFYNLLQATHKTLIAKIDTQDESVKSNKETLYNKMALNVFMNNLPEYLARILRFKSPNSLEEAYRIVQEEIYFMKQYSQRQTGLNTLPELQCFYHLDVVFPFHQQPPFGPGFDSPSSQVLSDNHSKESRPALFSSGESSPQANSEQNSPSSLKKSDSIDKIMKPDVHDDEDNL